MCRKGIAEEITYTLKRIINGQWFSTAQFGIKLEKVSYLVSRNELRDIGNTVLNFRYNVIHCNIRIVIIST